MGFIAGPDIVDALGAIVGNDDFFEEAPEDLPAAVNSGRIIECAFSRELGQKIGGAFNRSGHQQRKEGDTLHSPSKCIHTTGLTSL